MYLKFQCLSDEVSVVILDGVGLARGFFASDRLEEARTLGGVASLSVTGDDQKAS